MQLRDSQECPRSVVLAFSVAGRPIAKGRPRWDSRSHRMYTPQRTADAEEIMRGEMRQACSVPLTGPLELGGFVLLPSPQELAKGPTGRRGCWRGALVRWPPRPRQSTQAFE